MARNEDLMVRIKADIRELQRGLRQAARESDMAGKEIQRKLGPKVNDTMMAIGKSVGAAAAAYVSFRSVMAGGEFIVRTAAQFEKLNAQLVTIEGSTERAELAFERIESFATTTPFQLEEVVDAFIRLRARGLDPSMDALMAYGNVASGMSKSLEQVIEAVADAATGEFERLKEFGIKASKQGDTVRFTFQGITTEVRNSSAEIEAYLQSIGTVQFAGSMERQMDTLGGASSNLQDAIGKLALKIDSETGLTAALRSAMGVMTQWANNLSGVKRPIAEIEADIDRLTGKIAAAQNQQRGRRGSRGGVEAVISRELEAVREELREALLASQDMAELDRGIGLLRAAVERQQAAIDATREAASAPGKRGRNRAGGGNAVQSQIADLRELQAALDAAIAKQKTLQEQAAEGRPLSEGAPPKAEKENDERRARELQAVRQHQIDMLRAIQDRLLDEEALLEVSHAREMAAVAAINDERILSEQEKNDLLIKLEEEHQARLAQLDDERARRLRKQAEEDQKAIDDRLDELKRLERALMEPMASRIDEENDRFQEQKDLLKSYTDEEIAYIGERHKIIEELEEKHLQNLDQIRRDYLASGLEFLTHIKDDEVRAIVDSGLRSVQISSTYSRKMFEAQKAAAIANATVNAYTAASNALADVRPYPLAIAAAAAALANGFANVRAIQSARFGGGGAAGAVTGAANPGNVTQPAEPSRSVSITLASGFINDEMARQLAEAIDEAVGDGVNVRFIGRG